MAFLKVYQKEKRVERESKYQILPHICGIWKNDTDESISREGTEIQMLRIDTWTQKGKEGGTNWAIRMDAYTLPCVE